jgi:hypothetical protein
MTESKRFESIYGCDEYINKLKSKYKHVLISIGFLGRYWCYLDTTIEEALATYKIDSDDCDSYEIHIVGFDDCFEAYEIRE